MSIKGLCSVKYFRIEDNGYFCFLHSFEWRKRNIYGKEVITSSLRKISIFIADIFLVLLLDKAICPGQPHGPRPQLYLDH